MRAWPLIAVSSAAGAVGLLPVLPASGGFEGDLILLLALLELPSMCIIAAGFSSRSIFGEIGSAREAVLSVSYNIVFLLAIVSIAASQHTFQPRGAGRSCRPRRCAGWAWSRILVCLPAKLHLNPFSLPNAEQEIYSGPMTEYAGPELAMWELSHGLEWVAATGLVATLVAPHVTLWWLAALVFVALSFAIVLLLSVARRRHGAPRDRHNGALLLAMHAHLRGSGHFVRALHEVQIMNILTMLWKNLWGGSRTLLFPARPAVTERFRGLVHFDPALCTGCAICRFRCTSRAIEFKAGKGEFTWSYDPGQCTFCGRCVEGCKDHALSQESDMPAHLHHHRRTEEVLHRGPQAAASSQPRGCARSRADRASLRSRLPEAHNEHSLETISEETRHPASPGLKRAACTGSTPGDLNVRELAKVMNACQARFVTITAYQLPGDEGFRLEYHWDLDGQSARLSLSALPATPSKASTTSARPWTGSSARFTKASPSTSRAANTSRCCCARDDQRTCATSNTARKEVAK